MDNDLFWVGVILLILGISGVYLSLSGLSPTLEFGLQNLSALAAVLGLLFIPGGLIKGGLPRIGPNVRVVTGVATTLVLTGLLTASMIGINILPPRLFKEELFALRSPILTNATIIQGSYAEEQTENFVPKILRVVVGKNNTVVWTNKDRLALGGSVSHTVTHDGGLFDSRLFPSGASWNYTFARPGVFRYFCQPHPWMTASVLVEEAKPEG